MNFIGVDPGKSGGLAIVDHTISKTQSVRIMPFSTRVYIPELQEVANAMTFGKNAYAVIERVHAMPKQGVTSSFNFGMGYGWLLGIFDTLGIPYELVLPQKWKREFGVTADKNTSIEVAQRLFPDVNLMRTARCSKPHDGMAEALLMAEYARRTYR